MYTINAQEAKTLRTDPRLMKSLELTKFQAYDRVNSLIALLVYMNEFFDDFFIKEVKKPKIESPELLYHIALAEETNNVIESFGEISEDHLLTIKQNLKSIYKLNTDPEIPKDGEEYIKFIKRAKDLDIIDEKLYLDSEQRALKIKAIEGNHLTILNLEMTLEELKKILSDDKKEEVFKKPEFLRLILNLNSVGKVTKIDDWTYKLFNCEFHNNTKYKSIFGSGNQVTEEIFIDNLVINIKKGTVTIKNIAMCDDIIEFPQIYKDQKLSYESYLINKLFKNFNLESSIKYMAVSLTNTYLFTVETIEDHKNDFEKAFWHKRNQSFNLPVEYITSNYII